MKITSGNICMQSQRTHQSRRSSFQEIKGSFLKEASAKISQNSATKRDSKTQNAFRFEMLRRILHLFEDMENKGSVSEYGDDYYNASFAYGSTNTMKFRQSVFTSEFFYEEEVTGFVSEGNVTTEDGRTLSFNVSIEMSRSFSETYTSISEREVFFCDPLVLNVGCDVTEISDMKFAFDLDCDGKAEEINYLGKGSGFLALDKNNDGQINDGNELFGTKSGNGFEDLAAYDSDNNGWIDENDSIFDQLKIWMKDEDGKDILIPLKKANIGAININSVSSQFSLNDAISNQTKALIRSTGIFLKEDGSGVGTVQHVDLAVK